MGCVPPGAHVAPPGSVALKECGPDGVIDDMEDNNNQITVTGERGGYWYTYVDKDGSTVWPVPGDRAGRSRWWRTGTTRSSPPR